MNSFASITSFPPSLTQGLSRGADWIGLRLVHEKTSTRSVRNDHPERNQIFIDEGAMIEVLVDGHFGYAATADLSEAGLLQALDRALVTSKAAAAKKVFSFTQEQRPRFIGEFQGASQKPLDQASLAEITSVLLEASAAMKVSDLIVNRAASALITETDIHLFSSSGTLARSHFDLVTLNFAATASDGQDMQTRTLNGGYANAYQVGAEIFNREEARAQGERIAREALEILNADNCPSGKMDLILMPDQMMLQIHESIGHPLELDRILGDERNYAGWSFVKPDDFGQLRYGSKLMNVSFDPTHAGEFASYEFDDGGHAAKKEFLIQEGVLKRGLGSLESQKRSGLPGVANFRSASWNRAPIDRMANINLEPGQTSFEDMISSVKNGIVMRSNRSWSIDDYRNKFQFGCEQGQLIQNGRLTKIVKNPNYRGKTIEFWNRLKMVGKTLETFGTPYCGKGEPNQVIRVGHASPPCLFEDIEVFGGNL